MDEFEGVFEKEISHFIWAKFHIKLNHAIYSAGQKNAQLNFANISASEDQIFMKGADKTF